MSIESAIKMSMARLIERTFNQQNVVVNTWNEYFEKAYFAGCITCGYDSDGGEYLVDIFYSVGNQVFSYTFSGNFAELIRELDTE